MLCVSQFRSEATSSRHERYAISPARAVRRRSTLITGRPHHATTSSGGAHAPTRVAHRSNRSASPLRTARSRSVVSSSRPQSAPTPGCGFRRLGWTPTPPIPSIFILKKKAEHRTAARRRGSSAGGTRLPRRSKAAAILRRPQPAPSIRSARLPGEQLSLTPPVGAPNRGRFPPYGS
jgi:hypothetical protein